jgi:hypothetical protein
LGPHQGGELRMADHHGCRHGRGVLSRSGVYQVIAVTGFLKDDEILAP